MLCPLGLKEEDLVMQAGEPNNVDYNDEVMDDGAGNDYVEKTNTYSYTIILEVPGRSWMLLCI